MKTKFHRSVNCALISEASTSEKILDVFFLREKNALGKNSSQVQESSEENPNHYSIIAQGDVSTQN